MNLNLYLEHYNTKQCTKALETIVVVELKICLFTDPYISLNIFKQNVREGRVHL